MPPAWPGWAMISAQLRGGKAGVFEFVATPSAYTLPVLTSLAAFIANLGLSRFAAPISSSGPHFDLHQPGASSARDSNETRPVATAIIPSNIAFIGLTADGVSTRHRE